MIVFPQGSVIRMSTAVTVGQMLVVTNLKTRQDAICRVVKVRTFTNMQGYVEVEFTHKQEGYWGVQFSAGSPVAPVAAAPPARFCGLRPGFNSCSGRANASAPVETARRGSGSASGRYAGERSATSLEHARGLSGDCAATGHAYCRADC